MSFYSQYSTQEWDGKLLLTFWGDLVHEKKRDICLALFFEDFNRKSSFVSLFGKSRFVGES